MGRAEVKVVAGLDGVGEGDAASDDARPGLFKTGHHGTVRLYQTSFTTHHNRRHRVDTISERKRDGGAARPRSDFPAETPRRTRKQRRLKLARNIAGDPRMCLFEV